MYVSTSDPTVNFEHLFALGGGTAESAPLANSLFNMTTLQTLLSLGQNL